MNKSVEAAKSEAAWKDQKISELIKELGTAGEQVG